MFHSTSVAKTLLKFKINERPISKQNKKEIRTREVEADADGRRNKGGNGGGAGEEGRSGGEEGAEGYARRY